MRLELEKDDIAAIAAEVTAQVLAALKPLLASGAPAEDTLLTVEECAAYLRVEPGWIYKRTQGKEIPYVKLGRFCMFKRSEVDAWIQREGRVPQCADLAGTLRAVK